METKVNKKLRFLAPYIPARLGEGLRRDLLMSTGSTKMVEASPYDKLWGNGLSEEKSRMIPESQWPGKNLLGKVMTRLKGDIFHNAMSDFTLDEILQIGIRAKQEKS